MDGRRRDNVDCRQSKVLRSGRVKPIHPGSNGGMRERPGRTCRRSSGECSVTRSCSGSRTGILTGEIAPGTRLLEVPLANELGVSRGPVREALRQLEQEGLVEFFPHRGAVVVGVAEAEVETIYGIRALLEGRAFARACRVVTDDDLDALADMVERMIEASEAGDVARRDRTRPAVPRPGRRALRVPVPAPVVDEHRWRRPLAARPTARRAPSWPIRSTARDWLIGPSIEHRELVEALRSRRPAVASRAATAPRNPRPGATPRRRPPVIERAEVLVLSHTLSRTRLFSTGSNVTRDSVVVRLEDGDGRRRLGRDVPGAGGRRGVPRRWPPRSPAGTRTTPRPNLVGAARAASLGARGGVDGARRPPGSSRAASRCRRCTARGCATASGRTPRAAATSRAARPPTPGREEAAAVHAAGFRAMKLRIGRYDLDGEIAAIERVVAGAPRDDLDGRRQRRVHASTRAAASGTTLDGARLPLARGTAADLRLRGLRAARPGPGDPARRRRDPRVGRRRPRRTWPAVRSTSSSPTSRSVAGSAASSRSAGPRPRPAGSWSRMPAAARSRWPPRSRSWPSSMSPTDAPDVGRAAARVRRRREPDPDRPVDRAAGTVGRLDEHPRRPGPRRRGRRGRGSPADRRGLTCRRTRRRPADGRAAAAALDANFARAAGVVRARGRAARSAATPDLLARPSRASRSGRSTRPRSPTSSRQRRPRRIDEAVAWLGARTDRWRWLVGPSSRPVDLGSG